MSTTTNVAQRKNIWVVNPRFNKHKILNYEKTK